VRPVLGAAPQGRAGDLLRELSARLRQLRRGPGAAGGQRQRGGESARHRRALGATGAFSWAPPARCPAWAARTATTRTWTSECTSRSTCSTRSRSGARKSSSSVCRASPTWSSEAGPVCRAAVSQRARSGVRSATTWPSWTPT